MDPNKACWYCGKEATSVLVNSGHMVCDECVRAKRVPVAAAKDAWPSFWWIVGLLGLGMFVGCVAAVVVLSPVAK